MYGDETAGAGAGAGAGQYLSAPCAMVLVYPSDQAPMLKMTTFVHFIVERFAKR